MLTNKNAQLHYQVLDRCFSDFSRRYDIEDLLIFYIHWKCLIFYGPDACALGLIKLLGSEEAWQGSPQYRFYTSTLFPNLDLPVLCGFNEHRWRNYRALRNQVQLMESMMAEEYISHEQMMKLREIQVKGDATTMQLVVISTPRNIIINKINGKNIPHQMILRDIVNTFRKHPEEFTEWYASSTAALFTPPVFVNKKESKGYWF